MHTHELIEDLVTKELRGLCTNCLHNHTCVYHKTTSKSVIQCELYILDTDLLNEISGHGLCKTCDLAPGCTLPGRQSGVWHCNEFK